MSKRIHQHTPGSWGVEDPMGPEILSIVANPGAAAYDWIHVAQIGTEHDEGDRRSMTEHKANARLIAAAPDMLTALQAVNKLISEAAMTGFNCKDGDWAERLFHSQQATSAAIKKATGSAQPTTAISSNTRGSEAK